MNTGTGMDAKERENVVKNWPSLHFQMDIGTPHQAKYSLWYDNPLESGGGLPVIIVYNAGVLTRFDAVE